MRPRGSRCSTMLAWLWFGGGGWYPAVVRASGRPGAEGASAFATPVRSCPAEQVLTAAPFFARWSSKTTLYCGAREVSQVRYMSVTAASGIAVLDDAGVALIRRLKISLAR